MCGLSFEAMLKCNAVLQWSWNNVCAAWILCGLLAFYTVCRVTECLTAPWMAFAVSLWSLQFLLLWSLVLVIPALQRWWILALCLLPILVAAVWQVASLELYVVQCRFLSFAEISSLWSEAATRPLITEQLFSWLTLLFVGGFYALYVGLAWLIGRVIPMRYTALSALPLVLVVALGAWWVAERQELKHAFKPAQLACMPWSWLSAGQQGQPVAQLAQARAHWATPHPLLWQAGPSAHVAYKNERYKHRSVVVVLLESHAAQYLDGIGTGSAQHQACSPYLAQLAQSHIYFKNYFQSGFITRTASWSLLAGFPYFNECAYTPQLARLGLIPAFQAAGYHCDWIQATTPLFAHFHELAQNLGINTGFAAGEEQRMRERDDRLWSAWGMPDEQLFELAFERLSQRLAEDRAPYLQIILSVSNHNPYYVPEQIDGVPLLRDQSGGMRYTDQCLKTFMEQIARIDLDQRPIVFITADTSFRSVPQLLFDDGNSWAEPLESLRIPGVLVLPESKPISQLVTDTCNHEDVLAMLADLCGIDHPLCQRLQTHRRRAALIHDYNEHHVLTPDYYLYEGHTLLGMKSYWQLDYIHPDQVAADQTLQQIQHYMQQCFQYAQQLQQQLWHHERPGVVHRDQHWEVIDAYEKPDPHEKRIMP